MNTGLVARLLTLVLCLMSVATASWEASLPNQPLAVAALKAAVKTPAVSVTVLAGLDASAKRIAARLLAGPESLPGCGVLWFNALERVDGLCSSSSSSRSTSGSSGDSDSDCGEHSTLRLASAVRDYFSSDEVGFSAASCTRAAVVVFRADLLGADALELLLRPLESSVDANLDAVVGSKGGSSSGTATIVATATSRRCHILGREVRLPREVAIIIDYPIAWPLDSALLEDRGAKSHGLIDSLQAARTALRAAMPPLTFKVLQRHGAVWVPFVDPAQHWKQAAQVALAARRSMRHSDVATSSATMATTPKDEDARAPPAGSQKGVHQAPPHPPPPPAVQESLAARFAGQVGAVQTVSQCLSARDDADFGVGGLDGSPVVMVLLGPSGVGKSHLARQVASVLFEGADPVALEASGKLKRFAMNQYGSKESVTNLLGADKGHVGQCEGALTNALREHPDAVIVLDEFEKAHPSFAEACFLNAFGAHGFFSDSCGDNARVPTGAATFVLTSNFGAEALLLPREILQRQQQQQPFGVAGPSSPSVSSSLELPAARKQADARAVTLRNTAPYDAAGRPNPFLRAEARGRVSCFAHFYPYPPDELNTVLDRSLDQALTAVENRFNGTLQIAWTPSVIRFLANVYYGDDGSTSEIAHGACSRSRNSHDKDSSGSGTPGGSGSEGLRPVIRALGQFTELLRAVRAAGQLDPTIAGTVALFDVDSVGDNGGNDQGNNRHGLRRSGSNNEGGLVSNVDRQQCWDLGWVSLVVRPLVMLDQDKNAIQGNRETENGQVHLSGAAATAAAASPLSSSTPVKAEPETVNVIASNNQVCESCGPSFSESLQQPHRVGEAARSSSGISQGHSQQRAFQREHQFQAQHSSEQALHHHVDRASDHASELEGEANTAEAWAWVFMKYAAWFLAACFAALMVQALVLAPLLAALQWVATATVASLVVVAGAVAGLWFVAPPWMKAAALLVLHTAVVIIGQHPRKLTVVLGLAMVFMRMSARRQERKVKTNEVAAAVAPSSPPLVLPTSPSDSGPARESSNGPGFRDAPKLSSSSSAVDTAVKRVSDLTEARIAELRAEWAAETAQLVAAATTEARRVCAVEVDAAREEARAAMAQIAKLEQVVAKMQDARNTAKS